VSFTSSSEDVSGTGTFFTSDLEPGDFIRARGETDFFEVRDVIDDTNLKLVSASTYTANVACEYKQPQYIDGSDIRVTCDVYGRTVNNTSSGDLIDNAPEIVEELLSDAFDASDLDASSFDAAAIGAPYRVGLAIPEKETDKKESELREVVAKLNRSILGSIIQNNDFKLEYSLIEPGKTTIARTFTEADTIGFSVNTESDSIVSKVIVNYSFREREFSTGEPSNVFKEFLTDVGQFLVKTNKEIEIDTYLADAEDAERLAQRLAFIYELSRSQINLDTKLQGSLLQVNDTVILEHENLFERTASSSRSKVYGVLGVQKSARGSKLELYDLSGVYTRIANIMADDSEEFVDASDSTQRIGGYITDNFGMQDNDPDTFGVNLIY
jgi:hypothetical protein